MRFIGRRCCSLCWRERESIATAPSEESHSACKSQQGFLFVRTGLSHDSTLPQIPLKKLHQTIPRSQFDSMSKKSDKRRAVSDADRFARRVARWHGLLAPQFPDIDPHDLDL